MAAGDLRRRNVAVVAATAAEAKAAADALRGRVSENALMPVTYSAYLSDPAAPARIILCATRGPSSRGLAFLARASARLLWPAPPADIDAAIGGLRDSEHMPRRGRAARRGAVRAALLLEGPVDPLRARAALAASPAFEGPRDWIVESARHVRLSVSALASLARAGVRWFALEPVEVLAVYAAPEVAGRVRRSPWLPARAPVWIARPGSSMTR